MKGDVPAVCVHLTSFLPVRTHEFQPREVLPPAAIRKCLEIKGVKYENYRDACKRLKCSTKTIYRMLEDGRARYLTQALPILPPNKKDSTL